MANGPFKTQVDDPRICHQYASAIVHHPGTAGVTSVGLSLFKTPLHTEALALMVLSPADARQLARDLYEKAQQADAEMNATVQRKEGV